MSRSTDEPTLATSWASGTDAVPVGLPGGGRYAFLGLIGGGGMGEVYRARDLHLDRVVALKRMRPDLAGNPAIARRFHLEARITARLSHPGIIAIHDAGGAEDGQLWYSMREIPDAVTLTSRMGGDVRSLVRILQRVASAMAHAHARGVIHRDLKPANVLVGGVDEVVIVDWGLARALDNPSVPWDMTGGRTSPGDTQHGEVLGTWPYLAPEQAGLVLAEHGPWSDVYAIGVMLAEVLTGTPARTPPDVEPALAALLDRCLKTEPSERLPEATIVAEALAQWIDGADRRARALAVMSSVADAPTEAAALRSRAAVLRAEAQAALVGFKSWEAEDLKAGAWAKEDEADALLARIGLLEAERELNLHAALQVDPTLAEAHGLLAQQYGARHAAAEARRDHAGAAQAEAALRTHAAVAPPAERARWARYLAGDGAVTVVTDPPGAEVLLDRFVTVRRRLVAEPVGTLGRTPLHAVPVGMGSWRLRVRHHGYAEQVLPVLVRRGEHVDAVPPGATAPAVLRLPPEGVDDDDRIVPAGWFMAGGDPETSGSLSGRRVWVDDFVMRRFPVTNGEYLRFLDELVALGREEEALRLAPRERAGAEGELGPPLYGFENGRFFLRADADGDTWVEDTPVTLVDWYGASAYAQWHAERTGLPWRLPDELEWEKAARGVDGRVFPWGDRFDASWCCMRDSHPGRPTPASVASYPVDTSVYGVRGLAGNSRDWTNTPYRPEGVVADGECLRIAAPVVDPGTVLTFRGGGWFCPANQAHAAYRLRDGPRFRGGFLGFRLVRSLDPR